MTRPTVDEVMRLATAYAGRYGTCPYDLMVEAREKLCAAIESLIAAPAAPQQAEPVAWMKFGGMTMHDAVKRVAPDLYPDFDIPLYTHPAPAAPQQVEPVAQIGWADEFGNLFPMGAWKPTQRTHHDSHKTAWRAVYLHPPAAEVQRLARDFHRLQVAATAVTTALYDRERLFAVAELRAVLAALEGK